MRSFRLALIGLCIVAGVVGCANDDPWVGEWHVVVDVEAEIAEYAESQERWAETQETMLKHFEKLSAGMTEEKRIEFIEKMSGDLIGDEPIDIEKKVEEYAAKLRAVGEDEGEFLTFERGRDGALVAVYESRGGEDVGRDVRVLTKDVTESSELIRCKFTDTESGQSMTFELTLESKDLLEGSRVVSEKEPVKLERIR